MDNIRHHSRGLVFPPIVTHECVFVLHLDSFFMHSSFDYLKKKKKEKVKLLQMWPVYCCSYVRCLLMKLCVQCIVGFLSRVPHRPP